MMFVSQNLMGKDLALFVLCKSGNSYHLVFCDCETEQWNYVILPWVSPSSSTCYYRILRLINFQYKPGRKCRYFVIWNRDYKNLTSYFEFIETNQRKKVFRTIILDYVFICVKSKGGPRKIVKIIWIPESKDWK